MLRPVDTGLDAFPEVRLTEVEVAAIARGQFVRPEAGIPSHAERYRLVGPEHTLVAIAAAQGDRLAPDKVFVDAGALDAPGLMDVVEGVEALSAGHGRLFVVIGVFDGLHRGHVYLLDHLTREAAQRDARPTVITFDHHPDEVIRGSAPPLLLHPAERLELLAAAGVAVTVVQHFDEAVRRTPYDAFVGAIGSRVDLAGFLMTP